MNTCKRCKYFGSEIMKEDYDTLEAHPSGLHVCNLIKHVPSSQFPMTPHVVDGSDFYAALRVPEDFGCNRFEDL